VTPTLCAKNETRVILNLRTVVSLLRWNLARDVLMTLAIKRIHNYPTHLSYVSTLSDVTQKPKIYVVFLSIVWVVLKRIDLACKWLWKEPVVWLDHSKCSKWRPFAFTHARSRVCHWSVALSKVSMLQLVVVAFLFLCNVR